MTFHRTPTLLLPFIFQILITGCTPSTAPTREATVTPTRNDRLLNSGWVCKNVSEAGATGEELSRPGTELRDWMPATVPGTVLTTLLNNRLIPDPFYGMNNMRIPDIGDIGRDAYTYWFVNDFRMDKGTSQTRTWLNLRGVNYSCDIYLNGRRVNTTTHYGMYLRQSFDITDLLTADGANRLAVIVHPPDPVGVANGGQGGDGTIAHGVANQFVAGWDWIQPIRDRNTGIWDKVSIEQTRGARLINPFVVTDVPGTRLPDGPQSPVNLHPRIELENPGDVPLTGVVECLIEGISVSSPVTVQPRSIAEVRLPEIVVTSPKLWWPNGYGPHNITPVQFRFTGNGSGHALETTIGIREIQTRWNSRTRSREVLVNGQPVFIKGGNWVASDAMFRLSEERYDAEIRYHRDMNLNLIRIWGGGLTERPEFYEACDRYGIMVFQDFWMSGDCNGKWFDPMKSEDQWTRRSYPDDHALFLASVADQVKMLRNHPSLAFYCGGNEIPPPIDILSAMQDTLLPSLDGTRYFFTYSNVDSMSYNQIGGNGDGTYWLQPAERFWDYRSFPFNSEIGSVGAGDFESLERFIPPADLQIPSPDRATLDSVWHYHRYMGYLDETNKYGRPTSVREWADRAQLINFDQYRALMEGHMAHMWDWYTGLIIWKTQNPWTALRGQMYDVYLDPNAGLYGLNHANRPVHAMCHPVTNMLYVVNNTFRPLHDMMVQAHAYTMDGRDSLVFQWLVDVGASTLLTLEPVKKFIQRPFSAQGGFLRLRLLKSPTEVIDENLYWLPDSTGAYSGLQAMPTSGLIVSARRTTPGRVEVTLSAPAAGPLAFFNRLALVDRTTGKRVLPLFSTDNYVSLVPGEEKKILLEYPRGANDDIQLTVSGWNVPRQVITIR